MTAAIAPLRVSIRNTSARAINMRCLLSPDLPLRPLLKDLPGHPPGVAAPVELVGPLDVGAPLPAGTPLTITAARQVTVHAPFDAAYRDWIYNNPTLAPGPIPRF